MNAIQFTKRTLMIAMLASVAVSIEVAHAQGSVLKSSNPSQFDQWYGRAGGTIGSQRIQTLHAAQLPPASVTVTYDKDVAARTNMQRDGVDNKEIAITYDEAVAARTNMARGKKEPTPAVAKSKE